VSSSLPACRDTTCTDPRIEAYITCTCTNFGPRKLGRKSDVSAHNNWGVPMKVLTSVNIAPCRVVRKSVLYPPIIDLHGHRGSAWRGIKCVPLVTDIMGRVYILYGLPVPDLDSVILFFFFAPSGYGTGREPAPAPSTSGVLQARLRAKVRNKPQTRHRSCSRVGDTRVSALRIIVREPCRSALTPHEANVGVSPTKTFQ
jgi:hypothetical protein